MYNSWYRGAKYQLFYKQPVNQIRPDCCFKDPIATGRLLHLNYGLYYVHCIEAILRNMAHTAISLA